VLTGLVGAGSTLISGCREDPPTYGQILRIGDNFTYQAQRLILPARALVREYDHADISAMPATGTTNPGDPHSAVFDPALGPLYDRLRAAGFADWRLRVEGAVERPLSLALADLTRLARRTQITRHTCEEGWTAIAQWTGAPLATVLALAGTRPTARFVDFHTFDGQIDSIDMTDALHPQTLLAYGMNGGDLPLGHGAPLRLRVERQIGYKSLKFLYKIVVSERFIDPGAAGPIKSGWSWYSGIYKRFRRWSSCAQLQPG
jgi:DMSO/TMAO reductase YedYZ molybdopterin-dependent catalytic subunit